MPAGCPACHRAGQGTSLSNKASLGRHVLTAKHLRFKENLRTSHPDEYERLLAWEKEHQVAMAAHYIQEKRQAAIRSEQDMDLLFGISEEVEYPTVDMGVALEGEYGDLDEFGYEPDSIEEPGDPMIVDLEPTQEPNNAIDQLGETSDREDDVGSSDSESADMESNLDEQPTGLFYGQNDYFPNHHFFHPPDTEQVNIDEPDNEWFPFDSQVDAVLFLYCHSEGAFLSDQQVERAIWLLKMLAPGLKLPTLSKLKGYRSKIPRPEVARFSDQKNQPYYQISILDTIRMQSCMFRGNNTFFSLQQYPEIVHFGDHTPKALRELWHGEKWRHTPQLNRPMERIDIAGSTTDVWISDVLELHELTTGFKYAMYMGCEIHTNANANVPEKFYRMLKLTPNDDESRYYVSTQNASPRLDADAITLVTEDLILNHIPISKFAPIYGVDSKNGGINPIEVKPHPARALCESTGQTTDVRQINVSIWNDGLSGVRSKRWNPFEAWTVTFAGLPRTVRIYMLNIMSLTCE
jgi:hypothetical protein